MILSCPQRILEQIQTHGESSYPEEGAGLLLGSTGEDIRSVRGIVPLRNARETGARRNRYLIEPKELLQGEKEADRLGLDLIGIFHSHPDHPELPSDFDREWALPWFSYVITSVRNGKAAGSRSWRLMEDRSGFVEEEIQIKEGETA